MIRTATRSLFPALLLLLAYLPAASADGGKPVIHAAVAANFKTTLVAISTEFENQTGIEVRISSASTGVLAAQITHGAPFDIFFAADRERPEQLHAAHPDTFATPFCYARGALTLVGSPPNMEGLAALADPANSVAIANPRTAPYGLAAEEVLAQPQFSAAKNRKLVRGTNAMQAYQFWVTGAVDLALLPRSLAPESAVPVPSAWHRPIEQYAIVLHSNDAVTRYLQWLKSDSVRALISHAGYEPCH